MARRSRKKQRVSSLPDDLIVEILSRVPYRSLCLFKCVSRSWLALCSDPDLRKKSPQTLSGFFCYPRSRHEDDDYDYGPHLINLSGRGRPVVDPSPPLLEGYASRPLLLQCCSSLLLWRVWRSCLDEPKYIVSNPATQKWILLPPTEARDPYPLHFVRLGFDPAAMPSCFFVFMFVTTGHYRDRNRITGVKIYSSETGGWIFRQSEWEDDTTMGRYDSKTVFFNGTLYSTTTDLSLASIDAEGKTWRKIRMPQSYIQPKISEDDCFIVHSRGRLYAMHIDFRNHNQLSVWALGANGNEQWALEHTANITQLLGRHRGVYDVYKLIAAHPERNLIFLTGWLGNGLMSCDLDKKEVHAICSHQEYFFAPCLSYIPCFVEWSLPLRMATEG